MVPSPLAQVEDLLSHVPAPRHRRLAYDGGDFPARKYSRLHTVRVGADLEIPGSPSPAIVPQLHSSHDALDPESAFVAALSACHMLWFLDLVTGAGFTVASYADEAEGTLGRIGPGRMAMTRVVLRPAITFSGDKHPTAQGSIASTTAPTKSVSSPTR